jgi:hypothetical protein
VEVTPSAARDITVIAEVVPSGSEAGSGGCRPAVTGCPQRAGPVMRSSVIQPAQPPPAGQHLDPGGRQ